MQIEGKVYCLFEQSGAFKNAFKAIGIDAEDYDIENRFGETDHVIDLFKEIDTCWSSLVNKSSKVQVTQVYRKTIFEKMDPEKDFIIAFYPCTYFCTMSLFYMYQTCTNYRKLTEEEKTIKVLERAQTRLEYYERLIKFVDICKRLKIRMVFENPWTMPNYLKDNFLKNPDYVDQNRMLLGDDFRKPTGYWFWNCAPECTFVPDVLSKRIEERKIVREKHGIDRSLINPMYARNFIRYILGVGNDEYDKELWEGEGYLFDPVNHEVVN